MTSLLFSGQRHVINNVLAYLMKKYKLVQGFGQGQKYWSDPDGLTLLF